MTEAEEHVISCELWELFSRECVIMKHEIRIAKMISDIVFDIAKDEDEDNLHALDKLKVIEEIQLHWRLIQTQYQDLKAIAEILHYSDILPVPPELDFSDVRRCWIFDSDFDIFTITEKINDFEEKLCDLRDSWCNDIDS